MLSRQALLRVAGNPRARAAWNKLLGQLLGGAIMPSVEEQTEHLRQLAVLELGPGNGSSWLAGAPAATH